MGRVSDTIEESVLNAMLDFLRTQIKGYIDREVGAVAYEYGLSVGYDDVMNVWIYDPEFCEYIDESDGEMVLKYDRVDFETENDLMLGHYHIEDLLWLMTNIKEETFKMGLDVRSYARKYNIIPL